MQRRAVSWLISYAFGAAVIGYSAFCAVREWQFAGDLRANGVETDALVTKFSYSHTAMGTTVYDIAYDYAAGGSMHHQRMTVMRKPASVTGEHITATFLPDAPESSLPYAKSNIGTKVFFELWNETLFPFLAVVMVVSLLAYPFVRKKLSAWTR